MKMVFWFEIRNGNVRIRENLVKEPSMPFSKKIVSATLASLLISALPAFSAEAPAKDVPIKAPAKSSPADPLARVNGTVINRGEVDRAVKVMLAQSRMSQPLPPETMKRAEEAALDQLTSAELLYQAALKLEIKDLDKQIEEKVAKNREKFPSEEAFEKALKEVDMTLKEMKEFTRKDIIIGNFVEKQFADKTAVSDADAKAFYNENLERYFKKSESVKASHILIGADEKASAEDKKKAKEKAEALLKRVKKGEDFAALAKSDSTCPSSAQGGDLGNFGKGQMVPAFEKAAFGLKPGEVSDVVETQFGYHIIKLTEKHEASTETFEETKKKIVDHLKREKVQKALSSFVEDLKKTAKIEKL